VKPRVRYAEAPELIHMAPECGACGIGVTSDYDGWQCPTCGTTWDWNDYEQRGTLYADWSGVDVSELPLIDPDDGFKAAGLPYQREQRDALYARLGIKR
jgi:predicted RNA-binding Zn-ribbon protein involved in translation (DUF1610 family)